MPTQNSSVYKKTMLWLKMQRSPLLFSSVFLVAGVKCPHFGQNMRHTRWLKFLLKYVSFKVLLTVRKKARPILSQHMQTNQLFFMTISNFPHTHTRKLSSFKCMLSALSHMQISCMHACIYFCSSLIRTRTHTCAHTRALKVKLMMSVCTVGPLGFEVC